VGEHLNEKHGVTRREFPVVGGLRKKNRFGTAVVVEKYWHPPLLRVSWALVILMKSCVDASVCGCSVLFIWAKASNGSWGGGIGPTLGV
jgi:hypothetical protein